MITFSKLGRLGRLGNQMFQIASTIGVARASGQNFAFPYWKNYDHAERFGSKEDIDVQKYFANPLPVLDTTIDYRFQEYHYYWGYRKLYLPQGNWDLQAHMQSEKYFKDVEDEVRWYFEPFSPIVLYNICAIHFRFGDYDNHYHPYLSHRYIDDALMEFDTDQEFLVFSDDVEKAREYFELHRQRKINYWPTKDTMTDFYAMRSCRHFIISNSTYSWWAAWLGIAPDKKVVCPKVWHGSHTGLEPDDIPAENWIII